MEAKRNRTTSLPPLGQIVSLRWVRPGFREALNPGLSFAALPGLVKAVSKA